MVSVTDARAVLRKDHHPLPAGWSWRWQDDVFSFQGGAQPPASTFRSSPAPGYVRLIQIRDYYTDSHLTFVPDSAKLRKCTANDVMIARYGSSADSTSENSLGRICRGLEGAYNVALAKVVPEDGIDESFLFYLLKSAYFQIPLRAQSARSVQSGFNRESLSVISLPVPPPKEQRAIAHVLGTLDGKIELNRRMSETLEAIARALFKSWFVDFDPVRAKAEGRDPGLPPAIADLFPSSFEDSELGPIPAGWHVKALSECCASVYSGGTPDTQNPAFWNGGVPWLSSGETRQRFIVDTERTITKEGVAGSSTRQARAGTTVIASAGQGHTRGQTSLLTFDSYINQSVVAVVANPAVLTDLYLFLDLAQRYEQFRQVSDSSSSRGSLTTKILGGLRIIVPDRKIVGEFDRLVSPMIERSVTTLRECAALSGMRDTLLPKLISGETRITGADHPMETALST